MTKEHTKIEPPLYNWKVDMSLTPLPWALEKFILNASNATRYGKPFHWVLTGVRGWIDRAYDGDTIVLEKTEDEEICARVIKCEPTSSTSP